MDWNTRDQLTLNLAKIKLSSFFIDTKETGIEMRLHLH